MRDEDMASQYKARLSEIGVSQYKDKAVVKPFYLIMGIPILVKWQLSIESHVDNLDDSSVNYTPRHCIPRLSIPWRPHDMETLSALLDLCEGTIWYEAPVIWAFGEFVLNKLLHT